MNTFTQGTLESTIIDSPKDFPFARYHYLGALLPFRRSFFSISQLLPCKQYPIAVPFPRDPKHHNPKHHNDITYPLNRKLDPFNANFCNLC